MGKLDKPKVLLKIGTATLTKGKDNISRAKLEDIAIQIVELRRTYDVIVVCSGAIAAAKQFIKIEKIGSKLKEKQALASIGQPFLMRLIHDSFRDYEIPVGQCLLSYTDFENENSKKNIVNTVSVLLKNGILPIINENDTTATEEIRFGDNDKLSALTAVLLKVDLLVLATNTDGVYDNEKHTIRVIEDIDHVRESWIVNGHENNFLLNALNDNANFSRIKPIGNKK